MDAIQAQLRERYAQPHRHYHDLRHLDEVLKAVDRLAHEAADIEAVRWAVWFHDAVYRIGADDNEEQSAQLAELMLPPALSPEVARLVRVTAAHKPEPGDRNGAALCDADLRILASGPERYAEYVADVRAEYVDVPDSEFATGRAVVLEALLDGGIFHTATARREWEEAARANVAEEIKALSARR